MPVTNYFCEEGILLDLDAGDKETVLEKMVVAAEAMGKLEKDGARDVLDGILKREEVGSTGIGHGVAVPHVRSERVKDLTGVFCRLKRPVEFNALDGQPVDLFFMVLSPAPGTEHLPVLANIAVIARDEMYCNFLRHAKTPEDALEVIREALEQVSA